MFREKVAGAEFQNVLMRSMMAAPGTRLPENTSSLLNQKMAAVREQANHDLANGGPRRFPRNWVENETMKRMVMQNVIKAIPAISLEINEEEQRNLLWRIERGIEDVYERLLARRRQEQARGLWKKAACAVWLFLEFRASVERSVAPGGAAAKRARGDFESCAKRQC